MNQLNGKKGLVMGVANNRSIAWGIAKALHEAGAELAFTYQGEGFGKRLEPLAESVGSTCMLDVDVTDDTSLDRAFDHLSTHWGQLDFLVHALAFSNKAELTGRFINTTRANFKNSLDISAYLHRSCKTRLSDDERLRQYNHHGDLPRVKPCHTFYNVIKSRKPLWSHNPVLRDRQDGIANAIRRPMKTLAGLQLVVRKTYKLRSKCSLGSNATLEAVGKSRLSVSMQLPIPQVRLSMSTAAFTSWACPKLKIFDYWHFGSTHSISYKKLAPVSAVFPLES